MIFFFIVAKPFINYCGLPWMNLRDETNTDSVNVYFPDQDVEDKYRSNSEQAAAHNKSSA
jgi:hypothetical protein